jgi:hypothetical protein
VSGFAIFMACTVPFLPTQKDVEANPTLNLRVPHWHEALLYRYGQGLIAFVVFLATIGAATLIVVGVLRSVLLA